MLSNPSTGQSPATSRSGRILYLDSLRVLAMLLVFLFHASKAFTVGEWHVKNDQISMVATVLFDAFLGPWGMPFFFLLAGAGAWFALQRRSARQFAKERVMRLLIPYLVGSALFTPVQNYFECHYYIRSGSYTGSCLQFFIDDWPGLDPGLAGWIGYHLWFLLFLFLFSLLGLPLLMWLKGAGQGLIASLGRLCEPRGAILVFAIFPLLIQAGLRPIFPGEQNWADFVFDFFFFLSGYLIYANELFVQAIRRDRWLAFAAGSLALLGVLATLAIGNAENLFSNPDEPGYRIFWALVGIDAWSWSIVMLFVGMRFLDFTNQWLSYGQEAVVPFYLVHQPVIVALAYYVVQWQAGVVVKMPVVILISFTVTATIYGLLIRNLKPFRFLFGMKPSTKPQLREPEVTGPPTSLPLS